MREIINEIKENKKFYCRFKEYNSGDILFNEGDEPKFIYILEEGNIIIEKSINDEKKEFKELAIISAPSFVGEMAIFSNAKRSARARILDKAKIIEIESSNFFRMIDDDLIFGTKILKEIIKIISLRISHTSKELALLYDISKKLSEEYLDEKEFISLVFFNFMGTCFDLEWFLFLLSLEKD